jgi:hypothetical protein
MQDAAVVQVGQRVGGLDRQAYGPGGGQAAAVAAQQRVSR